MKYNYRDGITKSARKRHFLMIVPVLGMFAGIYVLVNTVWPYLPADLTGESQAITQKLTKRQPDLQQNRLYVPKIGVDVAIVEGVTESTLEGGAWHRQPQNGDPISGGNFVLAAHRFNLGLTPQQTRAKSPFYHIDKLQNGDQIYVDFHGVRYAYKVDKRYKVGDTELSIESRSNDAKMTMYSCDLRGPKAGREVVEASLMGKVAWVNGTPKLDVSSQN